jgi:FdhD protein
MSADCTEKINIKRFEHNTLIDLEDIVLKEKLFSLFLNGKLITKFTCANCDIKELTAGYLLCESRIRCKEELQSVSIKELEGASQPGLIYAETAEAAGSNGSAGEKPLDIQYAAVVSALREFQEMSRLFKDTGSVHSAALLDREYRFRYFSEDMSRHNAVEKVIGKAFLDGFYLPGGMLMSSSRMPLELIQKAGTAGISAVVSISAPTLQSIRFARENNIILAGMFRNGRINIYSDGK